MSEWVEMWKRTAESQQLLKQAIEYYVYFYMSKMSYNKIFNDHFV